jgi:putative ABC transport system permease protein
METLLQDLRYAFRTLFKNPGFTFAAVIALALGIGANSAIFSVIKAVLLQPLPFKNPDRLVTLWETDSLLSDWKGIRPVTPATLEDWKARNHVFEDIAMSWDELCNVTGLGDPEAVPGYLFSANFFRVLRTEPILGRTFTEEEDQAGKNQVVVLSYKFWQDHFAGDRNVLGKTITINGQPHTVIGVMAQGFQHPISMQLWMPLGLPQSARSDRQSHILRLAARLKPGVTLSQAQQEMNSIARALQFEHPDTNKNLGAQVTPIRDMYVGDVRRPLLALLGAVGFLLLIACGNVANLLLARATTRRKEFAIRLALGAKRFRLLRQLLTESVLLALLGGVAGLLMTLWTTGGLVKLFPNNIANVSIPKVEQIPVDLGVIGFALALSVLTGIVFGLAPAWQASRADLNESLKEGGRATDAGGHRMQRAFIVSEVALALVLLIGAGLMIRSFVRLRQGNLGFDPHNVLTMQIFLPPEKYAKTRVFVERALPRIEALPGVESAGLVNFLPLSGFNGRTSFAIRGQPLPPPGQELYADNRVASPNYFRAMRIPILKGRPFTDRDDAHSSPVVIINENLARRYFPNEDPIGKRLSMGPTVYEIVAVVGDVKHHGLGAETNPEVYRPFEQFPFPLLAFVVRTATDPAILANAVRKEIWAADKDQPIFRVLTMEQAASESVGLRRVSMVLLVSFGLLAVLLAALGVYGVMSYSVVQRTHEIGIRMALGARQGDVLRLMLREGMILVAIGLAAGLAAAVAVTGMLSSLLFGVTATDPVTFACIPVLLAAVALLANYAPAVRATKIDPMVALRYE